MDGSTILNILIGVALGTYFHPEVEKAVPLLKRDSTESAKERG